jgi:outer membrane protein OmpA-like peptidoglycan-associated protein
VQALEKGKTYRLSLYISLADYAQTYIDQLGFCFLPEEVHYPTGDVLTNQEPVYIKLDAVGRNISDWHKVSGTYKAKGREKFMIIGSFELNKVRKTRFSFPKNMKTPINKNSQRDAYYYVDDVSLVEIQIPPEKASPLSADTIAKIPSGTPLELHVLFRTNRSAILPESYSDLDDIVQYMKENPSCRLEIGGHTDNSGNEKENLLLSAKRAESVSGYLQRNGIEKERISCKGYGDTKSIFPNDTEEHKRMNRRVEITFVK